MFKDAKVGDNIWTIQEGWTEIAFIDPRKAYAVNTSHDSYTLEGFNSMNDAAPSAFWDEPKFEIPTRPKRIVTKTIEAWANVYENPGSVGYHTTEDAADSFTGIIPARIACVHLTGTYEVEE